MSKSKTLEQVLHTLRTGLIVAILGLVVSAHGQGLILRFEGQVTHVGDYSGVATQSGLWTYEPFNFSVFVDPTRLGTYVDENGEARPVSELSRPEWPGYYDDAVYAEFIEGSRLWDSAFEGPNRINYGSSTDPVSGAPFGELFFAGGPADDQVSTHWLLRVGRESETAAGGHPTNWLIGESFLVVNESTLNFTRAEVRAIVTLVGSSQINPVPEPSALGLLLLGGFGLTVLVRARSRQ